LRFAPELKTRTTAVVDCLCYMASSRQTECASTAAAEATLAKVLAPEDIQPGDFVTPLSMVSELPSFWWCGGSWNLPHDQPVRVRLTSGCDGIPLRVKSLCLPFVPIKSPNGQESTIDLRKCQVARLDQEFARLSWKAYKKKATKAKRHPPQ
jgi:hypothetical protein